MSHQQPQPTDQVEEVISRPNHLRFLKLEVESYAGLNPEGKSLVVVFPQNEGIVELQGDQGVGKTSLLNGIKSLLGNPEPTNAINSKSNNKAAKLTFQIGKDVYESRLTNKSFSLTNKKELDGKPISSQVNKPKDILSTLVPIGVSPDFLRKKQSGEEQIAWIKDLARSNPNLKSEEDRLSKEYKTTYERRTEINRCVNESLNIARHTGYLIFDEESHDFKFTEEYNTVQERIKDAPQDELPLKEKYDAAYKKFNELTAAVNRRETLHLTKQNHQQEIIRIDNEIARLQAQRITAENKLLETADSIEKADSYIKERETAKTEYETALENLSNFGNVKLDRQSIEVAHNIAKQYHKQAEQQCQINIKLTDTEREIKELAKEYTPDINNLEIELGTAIDNKRPAGVYYKGINIASLSESELWDLCLQVWRLSGVSVVFIENSTSLGSDAVKRINWFVQNGGTVFMSTMVRSYKELTVSFHNSIQ